MPAARAASSVRPTAAISGLVKMTRGVAFVSPHADVSTPAMWAPAILAWYLPVWVRRDRPLTSPTA